MQHPLRTTTALASMTLALMATTSVMPDAMALKTGPSCTMEWRAGPPQTCSVQNPDGTPYGAITNQDLSSAECNTQANNCDHWNGLPGSHG